MGLTDKELIASYFSLSQTYKDAGLYDVALKYFEKEYEIEKNNPIEVRREYNYRFYIQLVV